MDVELHPKYQENQLVYITYSKPNPTQDEGIATAVARGKLVDNQLTEVNDVFVALPYVEGGHHLGSRIQFDKSGFLYVSVGDRGERDTFPQSLSNHHGKIHRIHDDGTIPSDNPFINNTNAQNTIFSYGHRNPQGLAIHPTTGKIWQGEHGPQGGDEINILDAGKNYGWPVITYGIDYDGTTISALTEMDGMEQPLTYWVPSIAPCGIDFVTGDFYSGWTGDLLVGSLKFEYLHRVKMNGDVVVSEERLLENIGRVRDVLMGIDGYIYVAVEGPGRVLRILPE